MAIERFMITEEAPVERGEESEEFRLRGQRIRPKLALGENGGITTWPQTIDDSSYWVRRHPARPTVEKLGLRPGTYDVVRLMEGHSDDRRNSVNGKPIGVDLAEGMLALGPRQALRRAVNQASRENGNR